MHLPLIGGAYASRSIIASAQKCINLFPETNPKDSLSPQTLYQRPGLRRISTPPTAGFGRGLYESADGKSAFACVGQNVYFIGSDYSFHLLGQVDENISRPVSMQDNGVTLAIVDGSHLGWTVDLASNAYAQISDDTGTFQGGRKVDYIDTFLVFGPSPLESNQWISTTSNQVQFNGLFVGGKTDYPDPMQTLYVNRHEILLFGLKKSEIWYDAGNAQFPFAELPGAYIEHGTIAPYSVASIDISVFWLGHDLQSGLDVVFRQRGYQCTVISNYALSFALRKMRTSGADLSDACAYTYEQDGHYFYVLNFTSGNQTWVFDDSVNDPMLAWTQRGWQPHMGPLARDRVQCFASIYGKNCGLDWENGTLYELDPEYYADDVLGVPYPISFTRTFQHIGTAYNEGGQLIQANGKQIEFNSFMADMECGTIDGGAVTPQITLRYSDDRGRTFTGAVLQSIGNLGEYLTWPTWRVLGRARDRVFELTWTGNGQTSLQGCWLEGKVLHN